MFVLVQASSIWSIGGGEFPICGFFHLEMKLFFLEIGRLASSYLMCLLYGSIIAEVENCEVRLPISPSYCFSNSLWPLYGVRFAHICSKLQKGLFVIFSNLRGLSE